MQAEKNSSPKTCAITGTGGYLGGCVKRSFAAHGWEVLELTREPAGRRSARFQLGADVAPETLAGVQALVHCAYDFSAVRWPEIHARNVVGTRKLLAAARQAGVGRIICVSTISAYDGCRSLYGRAKLEIEEAALAAGAMVVRPGLIYGDGPGGMFGKLAGQVRKSSVLPLVGGNELQYLVHEQDLCDLILRHAEGAAPAPGQAITAAHPQGWSMRQILEALAHAAGRNVRLVPVPWRALWLPIKMAELAGLRPGFRSDSLVSLMHQNPRPDFSVAAGLGVSFRPFDPAGLKL